MVFNTHNYSRIDLIYYNIINKNYISNVILEMKSRLSRLNLRSENISYMFVNHY